jgi:hypothetical protein
LLKNLAYQKHEQKKCGTKPFQRILVGHGLPSKKDLQFFSK